MLALSLSLVTQESGVAARLPQNSGAHGEFCESWLAGQFLFEIREVCNRSSAFLEFKAFGVLGLELKCTPTIKAFWV